MSFHKPLVADLTATSDKQGIRMNTSVAIIGAGLGGLTLAGSSTSTALLRRSTKRKPRQMRECKEACSISTKPTGSSHSRQRDSSINSLKSSTPAARQRECSTRTAMSCLNIPTTAQAVDLRYPEESFAGFCLTRFLPARSAGDTKSQKYLRSAADGTC